MEVLEIELKNKDKIIINNDENFFILKGIITNKVVDIKSNSTPVCNKYETK